MKPTLNVLVSFAAGAALVWLLNDLAMQRRMRARFVSAAALQDQVRARIAELVTHPDAIVVVVEGGLVRVSGDVLSDELEILLLELTQLPGVHKVHNALSAIADKARFDELRAGRGMSGEGDDLQS